MKTFTPVRQQEPQSPARREAAPELLSPTIFWVLAILLVAGVFAVYSPALNYQFILDDYQFLNDPRVQSSGHVWEYFSKYVWAQFTGGPPSFYRPLFVLWLRINFVVNEMSSWGWHLFSTGKHVLVAILAGVLVWKLLRDRVAVLLAGTLFALHPAQAESVAWVTVPDPLTASAVLGSVLLYLKYAGYFSAEHPVPRGKAGRKSRKADRAGNTAKPSVAWLIASAVLCLAALLTKESAIVLPAMLFVLALAAPSSELGTGGAAADTGVRFWTRVVFAVRQMVPFFIATVMYFLLRFHAFEGKIGSSTQHMSFGTVLLSLPATLWFYVKALFWPVQSHAFGDSLEIGTFSVRGVVLPALAVGGVIAILAWSLFWVWKKAQRDLPAHDKIRVEWALLLGVLLLALPILPALDLDALNAGDFQHGRYTYLPSIGLVLLLATGWHLAGRWRLRLLAPAGLLAVAFAGLTLAQETQWKDNLAVFTVGNQSAPLNRRVALNLARAHVQEALKLGDEGRCGEALPVFERVTQQFPDDWIAWAAMGDCFDQLNDLPKAERYLHRAADLANNPRVTEQWQQVRARMGETDSVRPRQVP